MQAKLQEQLTPVDAEVILGRLPERIRAALIARAAEIDYPIEAVVVTASELLLTRYPDAQTWFIRIGHQAVYHFGARSLKDAP